MIFFFAIASTSGQDQSKSSGDGNAESARAEEHLFIDFEKNIRPLLFQYCADCHSPGEMEGLDFLAATSAADLVKHRALYASVAEQLEAQLMPPRDYAQPDNAERRQVVEWIKRSLKITTRDTDRIAPYVVEAFEDTKGNLWFGTMNRGVARYDGKRLTYFSMSDGLPANAVPSIAEDKNGDLWFGTQAGLCKFDGTKFLRQGAAEGLPLAERPSPSASASVRADNEGNIWVSVGKVLYRLQGKNFVKFEVPVDLAKIESYGILAGSVSFSMQDSKGNLWFKTDGAGAFKYDGNSFTQFTKQDGLCSNCITSILEDKKGNIWFTCMQSFQPTMTGDGGVCRLDGAKFSQFPEVEGLSSNDIYTICETKEGDIWIGATGVGAYRYDGSTFTLFGETDRKHWTRNFGLQSMLQDRKGTLWFGFSGGLFRFNGNSFFNVGQEGPWQDLVSAMAEVAAGGDVSVDWFHPDALVGLTSLANGNYEKAKAAFVELKRNSPNDATIQEALLNEVGYRLVFSDQLELSTEVFKINTALYPEAFNAFDSLAEAYLRGGDEGLAVKNYEKSLELNPANKGASDALRIIAARKEFENVLVAPDWLEEVLIVPPSFAPKMSLVGMEHLRLPPEFRQPDSDWFMSYLFAIELAEPIELTEKSIGDQLLLYFRGLASGGVTKAGDKIDTNQFAIVAQEQVKGILEDEFTYVLTWREPFAEGKLLQQNLRVKVIAGKSQHGVVFICGSPQTYGSPVWQELLRIRSQFESRYNPASAENR